MKTNIIIFLLGLLGQQALIAQRIIPATDTLSVTGQINQQVHFALAELEFMQAVPVEDQVIYNQKGEVKDTLTGMKGIPLKKLLAQVEYRVDKPRFLNEFYLLLVASDGYKVVFSWNEIYNSPAGDKMYLITELKGVPLRQLEQRILFLATADIQSGRRYIKGLRKIEVRRAD
ncbi:MAG: hypothetical protein H6581_04670 [Bacteroidia bacterium]|nr:hypothetical protein [Bacteroidia bacterium]